MSFNECKLVISIEDPRLKERRALGIEARTPPPLNTPAPTKPRLFLTYPQQPSSAGLQATAAALPVPQLPLPTASPCHCPPLGWDI